jgi:dienelactone hydrolase
MLACCARCADAQSKYSGIPPEHRKYTLADGVTERDVTYYSDGMACGARLFFPKGFDANGKTPAIVVAHGWTGTSESLFKYGNRFAERGFVAMAIDYRGWGMSDGFVSTVDRVETADDNRFTETTAKVRIKRTRLVPWKQVEDIRNAISYIQGEPGVDPEEIGLWGSSYAGGHVLTVASLDPRVSAVVSQVPGINYRAEGVIPISKRWQDDAIQRARTGQGGEFRTGYSQPRMVDVETQQKAAEYRPMHRVPMIPENVAVLFLIAENEELINNEKSARQAHALLKTDKKKLVEYPDIGHFDIYIEDHFEKASNEAADWYRKHLTADAR